MAASSPSAVARRSGRIDNRALFVITRPLGAAP
jgi:hypothetical protein